MTKITGPLFGTSAKGQVGDIGYFRDGPRGPQFVAGKLPAYTSTPAQQTVRDCFAAAKAVHSAIKPTRIGTTYPARYLILPTWPVFWAQWLVDHPECKP